MQHRHGSQQSDRPCSASPYLRAQVPRTQGLRGHVSPPAYRISELRVTVSPRSRVSGPPYLPFRVSSAA